VESVEKGLLNIAHTDILLGGYLNLNVLDGSCFWLAALAKMLGDQPGIFIDVASPREITDNRVTAEFQGLKNIRLLEPVATAGLREKPTRVKYADQLAELAKIKNYDAIIVRDTETALLLVKKTPQISSSLFAYVTGMPLLGRPLLSEMKTSLEFLSSSGATLLFQTREMLEHAQKFVNIEKAAILPPLVPDSPGKFDELFKQPEGAIELVYSGKFFYEWNPDGIISAFKAISSRYPGRLHLNVAGDQFRETPEDASFVPNVKYLLTSTPEVSWFGGLSREPNRMVIAQSDYGISWRRKSLDGSSELSTKVLEYGSLGLPVILNRTKAHEKLLGTDYPLFANSATEFKTILRNLASDRFDAEDAAKRCFALAQRHTYSQFYPKFAEILGLIPANGIYLRQSSSAIIPEENWIGKINVKAGFLTVDDDSLINESMIRTIIALAQTLAQDAQSNAGPKENKIPRIDFRNHRCGNTSEDPETLKRDLNRAKRQLANLQRSKAVRLQRKFWAVRNYLRRKC